MGKIITKIGACSTKKTAVGMQFVVNGSTCALGGTFGITGDSAVVSSDELGTLVVGDSFKKTGCRLCGNKHAFRCGGCGRVICYDGTAKRNFACPACGTVADVPAASGDKISTTSAAPIVSGGKTVKLAQGEEAKIAVSGSRGGTLTKITVGVGWDPASYGSSMDIDSSVIVAGGSDYEIVYFGDLEHPSGCVVHHGDNVTGEDYDPNSDDENISVYLGKVPSNRNRLIFVLNIYDCYSRNQSFRDVRNMYIKLYDPATRTPLIEYKVNDNQLDDTAIIIGAAYRRGSEWFFKAIGKSSCAVDVDDLAEEAVHKY